MGLPIMLIVKPRMAIIFWTRSPISFQHMSFCKPLLELHLTTYNSNFGGQSREVTELGTSTLSYVKVLMSLNDGATFQNEYEQAIN